MADKETFVGGELVSDSSVDRFGQCSRVIMIICGQHYPGFEWEAEEDVSGQQVVLFLQGQEFPGTATGTTATVPIDINTNVITQQNNARTLADSVGNRNGRNPERNHRQSGDSLRW